jgi:hypothetical protein
MESARDDEFSRAKIVSDQLSAAACGIRFGEKPQNCPLACRQYMKTGLGMNLSRQQFNKFGDHLGRCGHISVPNPIRGTTFARREEPSLYQGMARRSITPVKVARHKGASATRLSFRARQCSGTLLPRRRRDRVLQRILSDRQGDTALCPKGDRRHFDRSGVDNHWTAAILCRVSPFRPTLSALNELEVAPRNCGINVLPLSKGVSLCSEQGDYKGDKPPGFPLPAQDWFEGSDRPRRYLPVSFVRSWNCGTARHVKGDCSIVPVGDKAFQPYWAEPSVPHVSGLIGTASGAAGARLHAILRNRVSIDAARLQFIGMEDIAQAYGDRWPENKERIYAIASEFLDRRIHAADVFFMATDGFLIIFGSCEGIAAQAEAHRLGHALGEFFLGQEAQPVPQIMTSLVNIPAARLRDVVESDESHLSDVPQEAEDQVRRLKVDWRFQPVWDCKREVVTTWYTVPYDQETGVRVGGYHFDTPGFRPSDFAAVDESSLWISEQALQGMLSRGEQCIVGVSVHAATLANLATRGKWLNALDRLDRAHFKYRAVKIAGLPPGFPRIYLNEIVGIVRARITQVAIGAVHDEPDLAGLACSGPVAIGIAVPPRCVDPRTRRLTPDLVARASEGIALAHGAHMRFFVEGLLPEPAIIQARALGADAITSPLIWPAVPAPAAMHKWPSSLLSQETTPH